MNAIGRDRFIVGKNIGYANIRHYDITLFIVGWFYPVAEPSRRGGL
jgi:hypothetical protein